MKLLILALLGAIALTYTFQDYVAQFNKTYASDSDKEARKQLFQARMAEFELHNSQNAGYVLGPTTWTDRYDAEKKRALPVLAAPQGTSSELPLQFRKLRATNSSGVDWRGRAVTSIKDQGQCGSCWVFSAVATFESVLMLRNGTERDVSEQNVLECTGRGNSCEGGQIDDALNFLRINGGTLESRYPYTAYWYLITGSRSTPGICTSAASSRVKTYDFSSLLSFYYTNKQTILSLLEYSPISTSIIADSRFMDYKGGIFECNYTYSWDMVNHAIQIVGYNATGNYYIVKNSWGTNWGINGYALLHMDKDCLVRQRVYQLIWEPRIEVLFVVVLVGIVLVL